MAEVVPFKGLYYNLDRVGEIGKVATPPYDVITPEMRQGFLQRHPYNIVRLILPASPKEAGETFGRWLEEGVFLQDELPSLYPYEQIFHHPGDGRRLERWGFVALVRLEDGAVIGHERTSEKVVEERLKLLEATGAQMGQVLGLFSDPEGEAGALLREATQKSPRFEFTDDEGVVHRLWQVSEPRLVEALTLRLRGQRLLIADGHHRYATAWRFRQLQRRRHPDAPEDAPFEFVAMYLTPLEAEGLVILPAHRLFKLPSDEVASEIWGRIEEYCRIRTVSDPADLLQALSRGQGIGLASKRGFFLLLPRDGGPLRGPLQEIDAALVDEVLVGGLGLEPVFTRDPEEALKGVEEAKFDMAFLLRPPRMQDVKRAVEAGLLMPKKSTYFYPKVATGLVIYPVSRL